MLTAKEQSDAETLKQAEVAKQEDWIKTNESYKYEPYRKDGEYIIGVDEWRQVNLYGYKVNTYLVKGDEVWRKIDDTGNLSEGWTLIDKAYPIWQI